MKPEFFQLYSESTEAVQKRLELQFQQLTEKLSLVNRLLIEQPNIVKRINDFQDFHNRILDQEFREAFGFNATVVVYLYNVKRPEDNEFGRVYIPAELDTEKLSFMEKAIEDLKSFLRGEDDLERPGHLFLAIAKRVKDKDLNPRFQSYSTFLREIETGTVDALGPLPISPEAALIFKEEMLIVTPLHQDVGEFLVTVNTYVDKRASLFGEVPQDKWGALEKWYVTVHEAISECFLSVAHLLHLRQVTVEYETLQRISIISYLLSHPSVKLFTTPLRNAADELKALKLNFSNNGKSQEQFESTLDNIKLITDLWEGNLVVLEEFGAIEGDNNYSLDCQQIGYEEWLKIEDSLVKAAQVLFFNHINDLYDDPDFEDFADPILYKRLLKFSDFFRLSVSLRRGPICYGHSKLITLHLISFLENAIEASDFTKATESYRRTGEISDKYKNLISYKLLEDDDFGIIEIENDCNVTEQEEANLIALGDYIKTFPKIHISDFNKVLEERKFTTKSGTGFGWAVILAADYFYRLSITGMGLEERRSGDLLIDVLRDESGAPSGVRVRIRLPLPKEGSDEKVKIENKATGRQ